MFEAAEQTLSTRPPLPTEASGERRRKRENSLCAGSLVDQLHVVQNCGTIVVASDQILQTRCPIPPPCGGGGGGLGRPGKSLLIERRCGEWASPYKDSQVLLFLTLWVYPTSEWSARGVAFPLGEEMGIYQGSPSSTCVRPLPFSEGSLGNSVGFVPESSEMGQNRALFKCTTMQHCNQDLKHITYSHSKLYLACVKYRQLEMVLQDYNGTLRWSNTKMHKYTLIINAN